MNFLLPENVSHIIKRLTAAGYEAYAVGGCVRDSILGKTPKDWDITTSAEPAQIKALFRRTVDTGIKHGTVTVMLGDEGYETTTYRLDGEYEDSRHPKDVTFTKCLSEDLLRRDFTINAMAYNEESGLVDLFGGCADIEDKVIRCVGKPMERFGEDALRILRAYRFSARLGFSIAPETVDAARKLAGNLSQISYERIRDELTKLLTSPEPWRFTEMYEAGIMQVILPELNDFLKDRETARDILKGIGRTLEKYSLSEHEAVAFAWGAVCAAAAKDMDAESAKRFATHFMQKLKFDNDSIRLAAGIAQYSRFAPELTPVRVRHAINRLGLPLYDLWLIYLDGARLSREAIVTEEYLACIRRITDEIRQAGDCLFLKQLAVSGKDLLNAGFPGGIALGDCLNHLLESVLNEPENNKAETLLKIAGDFYSNEKQS